MLTVDGGHGGAEGHARAHVADGARYARHVSEERNACASVTHDVYVHTRGNDKQCVGWIPKDSFVM